MGFFLVLAVFAVVLAVQTIPTQAFPVTGWTRYYEGVEYATGTATSPRLMRAFALRISLKNPAVGVYASHDNGGSPYEVALQTTPAFLADHGLKAAVNACFFNAGLSPNTNIEGLLVSNGAVVSTWQPARDAEMRFTSDKTASIAINGGTGGVYNGAAGCEYNLVNGACLGDNGTPEPRTSGGITQDGKYAIFVCVDGRQSGWSLGATILDMAYWLQSFGAYNGMCFDGGGSTTMSISGLGSYVNRPCYGYARSVGASLGVSSSAVNVEGPDSVAWASNRCDVFSRGNLGHINQRYWTAAGGWSGLIDLGGAMLDSPAVCSRGTGLIDLFVRGGDNCLWVREYSTALGWYSNYSVGGAGCTSGPAACARTSTTRDVVVRGGNNETWLYQWDSGSGWFANYSIGGYSIYAPAICGLDNDHLDFFIVSSDYCLYHKSWYRYYGWTDWVNMGGYCTSEPAVCTRDANHMDVVVRGGDNALWVYQWSSTQGWYANYTLGGVCAGAPSISKQDANTMNVFVRGTNDHLYEYNWTSAGGWVNVDMGTYY